MKVFVSSTSRDLQYHRAAARHVVLDLQWQPVMMEHFGAHSSQTVDACLEQLEQCDLILLIIGFRRGWVPSPEQGGDGVGSITALELDHARRKQVPVLAFLASDSWPGNLWEDEADARAWVRDFRANLNLPAVFFENEPASVDEEQRLPQFRAKVREALLAHKERVLRSAPTKPTHAIDMKMVEAARDGLVDGTQIPFIGPGIYGDGPLGSTAIARALVGETSLEPNDSVATAAEYAERLSHSRDAFLLKLKRIIREQSNALDPSALATLDLLAEVDKLPLIVSATWDDVLERRLKSAGRSYAVVSHILSSFEGEHNGKILVALDDGTTRVCLADKLELPSVDRVIYKPLGSPFHQDLDKDDIGFDTTVITESDHLKFLGRLEHEHTQIPPRFQRQLQRWPVLFIGYALDVWQYRLVVQVFHTVGIKGRIGSILAVRTPGSPMEQMAWERLGADLIPMSPDVFATDVKGRIRRPEPV